MAALRFGKVGMAAIIDTKEERITIDRVSRTSVRLARLNALSEYGRRARVSRILGVAWVRDAQCVMRVTHG